MSAEFTGQKNKPYFSIAVPAYEMHGKGAEFLNFALTQLSAQSFKDYEVVVSDHSLDDSVENTCKKWSSSLKVKYIRNENGRGSSSANVNNAMKNCEGEWIKILFQDDFMRGEALQEVFNLIQRSDSPRWIVTASAHSNTGEDSYFPFFPSWNEKIHLGGNTVGSPSVLFLKNEDLIFFDEDLIWLMDVEYYRRMKDRYGEPIILDKILAINRTWGSRLSDTIHADRKRSEVQKMSEKYGN
jgi:glycosyltransferase involved in cell wall biosynthesis